jgi:anti-sigma B factor antagonist
MDPQISTVALTDLPVTELRLTTTRSRDRSLITVTGDIDLLTAPDLHTYLCAALDDTLDAALDDTVGSASTVVVDLSEVTFMDARGLTALLRAEAHARDRGARLHLTALPPPLTRLLHITHLDQHFDLRPTHTGDRSPGERQA